MTNHEGQQLLNKLYAGFSAEEKFRDAQRQLERLLKDLLAVADALHDLESHCAELEHKGVEGVPRKSVYVVLGMLMSVLKSHQVEPMNCKGQAFDLDRHEVLDTKKVRGGSDDVVLEESIHGYLWQDRVLRHAKVIISRAEAAPDPVEKESS